MICMIPCGPFSSSHAGGGAGPFSVAMIISETSCVSLLIVRKDMILLFTSFLFACELKVSITIAYLQKKISFDNFCYMFINIQ